MKAVFVGGCPRSGTTLLGSLLGAHSRCVCVPESQFKIEPLLYEVFRNGPVPRRRVAEAIAHESSFRAWGISPLAGDGEELVSYVPAMEDLVHRYATAAARPDAAVWVDHTPSNVLHARTLLERYPDSSFVHLVRDGRAIAASQLPLAWGVDTMAAAAEVWAAHLGRGLAAELAHPGRVHRVHYEDVVRLPEITLGELAPKLGLEREPQLGREARFVLPRATTHQHALVGRPPDPRRAEAWRESLHPRQIEVFESLAGDLLADLGYPLDFGGRPRPPSAAERARTQLLDAAGVLKRLGWRAADLVRHRLHLGRPDGF